MKIPKIFFTGLLTVLFLAVLLGGEDLGLAAVTFTNLPVAVSNTYNGKISLLIGGLTNGETVVIQKFLDRNTNGVIDAGDLLVQQFNLTDGSNSVIGGVTNFNVPGDLNTATGAITATLDFQNGDFAQNITGHYLYKLSSLVGHFTPLTNSFAVTNFPYAQKITGNVVNSGTNVPNAVVFLSPPASGNNNGPGTPVAGAVANNSGAYTILAPPGTYVPFALSTNFIVNYSTSPTLALGSSQTITTNLTVTNATAVVSGQIVDANNSGLGLPGVFMSANSKANGQILIAVCFSDTNGYFTLPVTSGQWGLGGDDSGLIVHGYVGNQNKTNVNFGTTGITLAYSKATALFYGRVTDGSGNPLANIDIGAYDNNNGLYQADSYTDTNGDYVVGAVGGLGSGDPWWVGFNGNSSSYIFSQTAFDQDGGTNISAGQAVPANFTGVIATNYISGNVQFDGTNVVGVGVSAYATISGAGFNAYVDTDGNGNYSFPVANGNWSVNLNCNGNNDSLDNLLGSGNYQCPATINVTVNNGNVTTNFMVQPASSLPYQISGSVTNNLGNPVVGVEVDANDGTGQDYSASTDGSGGYSINVGNGNWTVSVNCAELNSAGYGCVSSQQVNVSGGSVVQDFTVQSCGSLQVTTTELPDGVVNDAYYYNDTAGFQLQNDGCNAPFTWTLSPGSLPLPAGLNLASDGIISGTNMAAGTNYFSVRVTDNAANTADQLLSVIVYPMLQITNTSLPNGTLSAAYSAQLGATGGAGGYFGWNVSSGSLPLGLNLSLGGLISGTPTQSGSFPFTVTMIDNSGYSAQTNLTLIVGQSLTITTTSLTNALVGLAYTNRLQAVGGTTPYTWTIANGSQPLPAILNLSTGGIISGKPATNGVFSFIVRVTDVNSLTTTRPLTLTVNPQPVLGAASWQTNQFKMLLTGATNQNYTLQTATNLVSPSWISLFVTNSATTNSFMVIDPHATNSPRFYRILIGP